MWKKRGSASQTISVFISNGSQPCSVVEATPVQIIQHRSWQPSR
jgi:hypothetical protein